jgi:hypothetical protein
MTPQAANAGQMTHLSIRATRFLIEWSEFSLPKQFHSSGLPWLDNAPPFRP